MKNNLKFQSLFLLLFLLNINMSIAQNENIKKSIDTFFEGLNSKDTIKIKSVCLKNFTLQSIEKNGTVNSLSQTPTNKFFKSIASIPTSITIEEKILDYKFQIDEAMAIAWMPYEFYINKKLSHSGVNVFTLIEEKGTWFVISIIDTRRKPL